MKYSLALAAWVSVVVAQVDPTIIPPCARDCLNNATLSATSCKLLDFVCACQPANYAAIQSAATGCVVSSCGADVGLNQVIPASKQLCAEALGTASGGAGGGGGGPIQSGSPPPPNGAPSASSAGVPVPLPTPTSMPGMSMSSAPPMVSSTSASTTSSAPPTMHSTTAKNATATATHTPVPGAAAGIAPVGGLALLILGVLAI